MNIKKYALIFVISGLVAVSGCAAHREGSNIGSAADRKDNQADLGKKRTIYPKALKKAPAKQAVKKKVIKVTKDTEGEYSGAALEGAAISNDLEQSEMSLTKPKGDWITLPDDFTPLANKVVNVWNYSMIKIPETELIAGLGPWSVGGGHDNEYKCYGIDIEWLNINGVEVIAELVFDLKYVSQESIHKKAMELITFDEKTRKIKFDLGNSVFEYQLQ